MSLPGMEATNTAHIDAQQQILLQKTERLRTSWKYKQYMSRQKVNSNWFINAFLWNTAGQKFSITMSNFLK